MTTKKEIEFNSNNISIGSAILAMSLTIYWTFGIVLSEVWYEKLTSIIFPPYAFLVTSEWLIKIINTLIFGE